MPETAVATSVLQAVREATGVLQGAGCDAPRLDAELLLASTLGVTRARLVIDAQRELEEHPLQTFQALIARRASREPLAYILGVKEFRRIALRVDQRALIPRPETELLVEIGLSLPAASRVVDVGTGSGAVALALKDERPDLAVWGTDLSAGAVALARENAVALGLDVRFVEGDLLASLACDAVLANLPYVARDGPPLPPEIACYEPLEALFGGGPDGLDLIERLITSLEGAPIAALEVGFDQAARVAAMLKRAGFTSVQRLRDLASHERVLVGRR